MPVKVRKLILEPEVAEGAAGKGLKTLDAVQGHCGKPRVIKPSLREFEALLANEAKVSA